MNKRIIAALLPAGMLLALPACGKAEDVQSAAPVSYASLEALEEVAGFPITLLPMEPTEGYGAVLEDGTLQQYALLHDTIAITEYRYQDSVVELRMSVTEEDFSGLSGVENGKYTGGLQLDDKSFSTLSVYQAEDTYYCEFSYQAEEGKRYYALSRTETDFNGYTEVLQVLITTLQLEQLEAAADE